MNKKNTDVLLFNRSFWPDVEATGQFLTELCEQLAKRYKITVIAGCSYYAGKENFPAGRFYYAQTFNGITIFRVRHTRFWKGDLIGRIANWLTYSILAFALALKIKPKIIIVCTDPPFLGIIGMVLSRIKSVPFIYNCRDLFPDVAVELGRIKQTNFLSSTFDYFNRKALNSALSVICLGQSMEKKIMSKRVLNKHIRVIPDWVDTSRMKPVPRGENPLLEKFGMRDKFIIMYSGNIGLSQDFSSILQSVSMLKDKRQFYLIFIGEGSGKEELKIKTKSLGLENVVFIPYQPLDMLSFSLSMADLHLVPLKKGMAGAVIPSKIYGIMSVGKPYLAVTDRESEPASLVEEFGCGLWAEPDDLGSISNAIYWALNHPEELEKMGQIGRHIAETRFDKNLVIREWFNALENLSNIWYA